jgi:SM-20-related protein
MAFIAPERVVRVRPDQLDDASLQELGLYLRDGIVTLRDCQLFCNELNLASKEHASVTHAGVPLVDEARRRTRTAHVTPETIILVQRIFRNSAMEIGRYFGVELGLPQRPIFLRYTRGDCYSQHIDNSDAEGLFQSLSIRRRLITAIICPNAEDCPTLPRYEGGQLRLYRLKPPGPKKEDYSLIVPARPGRLVAFRANIQHEVTIITRGVRYSIVTWFERRL